jgi:hypothetical protein
MAPRLGTLSQDTWNLAAIWFRNTLLNQVILILTLSSLLLVPAGLLPILIGAWKHAWLPIALIVIAAAVALASLCFHLASFKEHEWRRDIFLLRPASVQLLIVLPAFVAAFLVSGYFGATPAVLALGPPLVIVAVQLASFLILGLLGRLIRDPIREWFSRTGATLAIWVAAWLAVTGIALYGHWAVGGSPRAHGSPGYGPRSKACSPRAAPRSGRWAT